MRSTSAAGGSSITKCRASLVEMNRAVDGCRTRMSMTRSPSRSPPPAGIIWPSTRLLPVIVARGPEQERAALARPIDRPPGEGTRHFGDVLLRVAAVHAERVQLHQLARVVLVEARAVRRAEAAPRLVNSAARHHQVRARAHPVVEIEEHRGMPCRGQHEVPELAEHVRTNRLALVGRHHPAHGALLAVDVEVVEPELLRALPRAAPRSPPRA